MALDYGSKTVGVAVNEGSLVAFPLEIIRRDRENALRKTFRRVQEIASQKSIQRIVVGLPLNMDRTEGERAQKSREFAENVARHTGLPVEMRDETLTTVEADERMKEAGVRADRRDDYIDSAAAAVILEDWLSDHEGSL